MRLSRVCLAPNALLVEKILLQLEYIKFKANVVICTLLRMPYSVTAVYSDQDALLGIVSINECPTLYSSAYVLLGMPEMQLFGARHSE